MLLLYYRTELTKPVLLVLLLLTTELVPTVIGLTETCTTNGFNTECQVDIVEHIAEGTEIFDATPYIPEGFLFVEPNDFNTDPHFSIDSTEMILSSEGNFDREDMVDLDTAPKPVEYSFQFFFFSSGFYYVRVNISVIDIDDNVPKFYINNKPVGSNYSIQTQESKDSKELTIIQARDFDEGINGTWTYELGEGSSSYFNITINSNDGGVPFVQLISIGELDREEEDIHFVYLIAKEGTEDPNTVTLNISIVILDVDDNPPSFPTTEYDQVVNESLPVGTDIIQVQADDPDEGLNAEINYQISNLCSIQAGLSKCITINQPWPFSLDMESGMLTLAQMLDYNDAISYRITIGAKNPNNQLGGSATAIVKIEVQDTNNHAPKVTQFTSSGELKESSESASIATFTVADQDSPMFSYYTVQLIDKSTLQESTVFALTNISDRFTVILVSTLDREEKDSYDLEINVTDSLDSSLSSTHSFTIQITDSNDNEPIFETVDNPISFPEESSISTLVVQLNATDKDIGTNAQVKFSLPENSDKYPYQNMFTIGVNDGKIHVKTVPDREETPVLFILVKAEDSGSPPLSTEMVVNFTLTDINDNAPVITTTILPSIQVKENQTLNTLILDVDASDKDIGENADLTFLLSSTEDDVVLPLSIDSDTGVIRLNDSLDHETKQQYGVQISVTDGHNTPAKKSFNLIVLDVNDNNPYFPQMTYIKPVYENASVNTYIVTVKAKDIDSAEFTQISYSFASGFDHSLFNLNSQTGEITTASSLDREVNHEHIFEVVASDGNGLFSLVNARVTVTVADINDEIPKFTNEPYVFNVDEGVGAEEIVGQVTAISKEDGNHGKPVFSIINTDPVPFTINPSSGVITPNGTLDREKQDSYTLVVKVDDVAPPINDNTTEAIVIINDVNDNPPLFQDPSDSIQLSELENVNKGFYTAVATDIDAYPNNVTVYSLDDAVTQFQIDPTTGVLSLTTSLNYEKQQSVLLEIFAKDKEKPVLFSNSMKLNITVLDDNNTNITFPNNFPLQYHIREDAPIGKQLLNFTAQDSKGNPQLHLNYFISTGDHNLTEFGIDVESDSGYAILTTTGVLDREAKSSYKLNITITDHNVPQNSVTQFLNIYLLDVNDNSPKFGNAPYVFSIEEEQPGKLDIGPVKATDPDLSENGTITYSLQEDSILFSIDSSSGTLSQLKSLNHESQTSHSITVVATDGGSPPESSMTTVTVNVLDINDHQPDFSPTYITVEENIQTGTVVETLLGIDADSGSNGEIYFYVDNSKISTASSHFSLYPNGTLVVIQVPDYEEQTSFIYFIKVTDGGMPPLERAGNITIEIKDQNDNPPKFLGTNEYYMVEVSESESMEYQILTIEATDDDAGMAGDVNYRLESHADANLFMLGIESGVLSLRKPLDYELKSQHVISVLAYDNGSPRNWVSRQNVTINVINVDDNDPEFDNEQYYFVIQEGKPSQTVIGSLRAYDKDIGSDKDLTYKLNQHNPEGSDFMVYQTNGYAYITTEGPLDYELHSTYILELTVASKQKVANTLIQVFVTNENDNDPSFSKSTYSVSTSELSPIGTSLLFVAATDADNNTNDAVSYSITSVNDDNVFYVDPATGEIRLNEPLDYESRKLYELEVTAVDTGEPPRSTTTTVTMRVVNENEHTPEFSSSKYSFTVQEEQNNETVVGDVVANDNDSDSYGIVSYSFESPNEYFTIDASTGTIKTKLVIDREQIPTISDFIVVASDSFKSSTATVTVTMVDINDNGPVFQNQLYQFSIAYDLSPGVSIDKVTPTDIDLPANSITTFSLTNVSNNAPFAVNSSSGYLYLTSSLPSDYENVYKFTLVATDSGDSSLTSQTTVEVFTFTSTDHPPFFEELWYEVNVTEETTLADTDIITVKATDEDDDDTLTYSLQDGYGKFTISSNGVISLTATLDHEDASSYEIIVFAADSTPSEPRTASTTVLVTVININDNMPEFTDPPSAITLSPVPFINVQLFTLKATDPDLSTFSFSVLSQTDVFKIDAKTGIVSNIIEIVNGSSYSMNVRVSDGVYHQDIVVKVSVLTPPDNSPSFNKKTATFSISEGEQTDFTVHTFVALNPSEYNIVCCESNSDVFKLDTSSGELTLKEPLDYETKTDYELIIEARYESNNVIHSDYKKVDITITNVNEYTPTFTKSIDKTVNEGLGEDTIIAQVKATDDDHGSFGDVEYSIIQGNIDQTFDIDSSTGVIKVAVGKELDREKVSEFALLIKAVDGGGKLSSSNVTIAIQDKNDSPPTYSSNFTIGIYETAQNGDRVAQVTASDQDSSAFPLSYALGIVMSYKNSMYQGVATSMFKINSSTAVVTLHGSLNRENIDLYRVQVTATDNIHNGVTWLDIKVLDVNDNAPTFTTSSYTASINELSNVGEVLINNIEAMDNDDEANGIVQYSLEDDWPTDKFIIDKNSGQIRVKGLVEFSGDCEFPEKFTGTVLATDGLYTSSATVTVMIIEINNHKPKFIGSPYTLSVSETAQVGDVITSFSIQDDDCASNQGFDTSFPSYYHYPYQLFEHEFDNVAKVYNLKVKAPLVQGVFHFWMQAYNSFTIPPGYFLSGFGYFIVTVFPENMHTPEFQVINSYLFQVHENRTASYEIGSVKANDADIGVSGKVTYSMEKGSLPFDIDANRGNISVTGSLDYEKITEYSFWVMATDNGYPAKSSNVSVTVRIIDVNDNPPVFSKRVYETNVTENVPIDTKVLRLDVIDNDTMANSNDVRYSLLSKSNVPFAIGESSGIITTSDAIDYERETEYEFSVQVQDLSMPTLVSTSKVMITVDGENEFAPVFGGNRFFEVVENQQYVGTINATDKDNGPDGALTYSFSGRKPDNFFMHPNNGSIYFNLSSHNVVRRRRQSSADSTEVIFAEVKVEDGGSLPLSAKTNITLFIPRKVAVSEEPVQTTLPISVIGGVSSSVFVLLIIFLAFLIIGVVLYKNSKRKRKDFKLSAENPHRSSTRASTPGTTASEVELHHYIPREGRESNTYIETQLHNSHLPDDNSESPDNGQKYQHHSSPRTRSTSDLASSVATDTLNLTQEGAGFHYSKAQIEQIYATNMDLLNDHSQDSVHMFGSEGGGEAEGDEMDDMMFAKYGMELEGNDDMSYCGKSRNSLISESSEGGRDEYQFSQSTNPWSSRHSIADRSMNELTSEGSRQPPIYIFESSQPGPGMYGGASTQGSTVSLTRSLHHHRPRKYGSERDIPHHYPPPPSIHHPHPSHMQQYDYYHPELPHPPPPPTHHHNSNLPNTHRYMGSPILEYRTSTSKPPGQEYPPPPYLSQDPYMRGHNYYSHMDSRISPDPNRSLPNYENLLSSSSTSLSTNASHSRGRPYPLTRERYH